jgi:hypothetical protein
MLFDWPVLFNEERNSRKNIMSGVMAVPVQFATNSKLVIVDQLSFQKCNIPVKQLFY